MNSFLLAFLAIALAELGDKSQLITLYLSARTRRPWAVLAGISLATVALAVIAVSLGTLVGQWIDHPMLDWLIALAFIGMGLWVGLDPGTEDAGEVLPAVSQQRAFWGTASLFFLMEMGDKTQLATFGLAAGLEQPAMVFLGSVLGMMAVNAPVIWLGHRYAASLPRRRINQVAASMFVLIGLGLMLGLLLRNS
ncbi:MAG: TMEM165/GDT1 family protein [Gammaproteobacteria bacterium]|nr:TMEM165/GDT1 family protein [Gammaproteobacteria bacterium]